jgi:predicted protein tyrosine phosphatase
MHCLHNRMHVMPWLRDLHWRTYRVIRRGKMVQNLIATNTLLEIEICGGVEAVTIVKNREQNRSFHAAVSIEHPCDESTSIESGRAPRFQKDIGDKWVER